MHSSPRAIPFPLIIHYASIFFIVAHIFPLLYFNVSCLLFARVAFNFLANWFSPFQPLVLHSILALSSRFPSQPILFCVFPSLPCLFALIKGYTFHFLRNFRNFLYSTKSFGMIFLNVLFSRFVSKTRFSKHK